MMQRSAPVRAGLLVAAAALACMAAGLSYAFSAGDWDRDVGDLIENPWAIATLVDVYVGLGIFAVWVCAREASPATALLWVSGILLTGNVGTALYVLRAACASAGDAQTFWMGRR